MIILLARQHRRFESCVLQHMIDGGFYHIYMYSDNVFKDSLRDRTHTPDYHPTFGLSLIWQGTADRHFYSSLVSLAFSDYVSIHVERV